MTAPIYPTMNTRYEPPIYEYTYLLSPAKTWAEFGDLDIVVNTPYYMTVSGGLFHFEQMENGYRTSIDGLPEEELMFILSESEDPKAPNSGIPLWLYFVIVFAAYWLRDVFMNWKRKKKE